MKSVIDWRINIAYRMCCIASISPEWVTLLEMDLSFSTESGTSPSLIIARTSVIRISSPFDFMRYFTWRSRELVDTILKADHLYFEFVLPSQHQQYLWDSPWDIWPEVSWDRVVRGAWDECRLPVWQNGLLTWLWNRLYLKVYWMNIPVYKHKWR